MANGVNLVIAVGNLGRDVDLKYTPDGNPVANFSVAASESWTGQDGQKHERTEWIRVVAWRKLAEVCGKYLHKGSKVYVQGKLQTRSWEKDGVKHYQTEVLANEVRFLDPPSERSSQPDYSREAGAPVGAPPPEPPPTGMEDDGLPF